MTMLPLSLFFSIGCSANMVDIPVDAVVSFMPTEYQISWSTDDNVIDRAGRMLIADISVSQVNARWQVPHPLEGVRLDVMSLHDGVYVIPQEAVELKSFPGLPGSIQNISDLKEACTDAEGNFSHENGDYCAWYWDTQSHQFYQFSDSYADAFGEINDTAVCGGAASTPCEYFYGPTFLVTETDHRGIARIYIMVDSLPGDGENAEDVQIMATSGYVNSVLTIGTIGGSGG